MLKVFRKTKEQIDGQWTTCDLNLWFKGAIKENCSYLFMHFREQHKLLIYKYTHDFHWYTKKNHSILSKRCIFTYNWVIMSIRLGYIHVNSKDVIYLMDKCVDIMHVIVQVALPISKTIGKTSSHCLQIRKKLVKFNNTNILIKVRLILHENIEHIFKLSYPLTI